MRTTISVITGCAALLATSTAFAQDQFATQGTLALSADRLFGLTITTNKVKDNAGNTTTDSATTFTLLGANGVTSEASGALTTYAIPRLGIDYFVIDGLSLGGSLLFFTRSTEEEVEPATGPTVTNDGPSTTAFAFMPRVGYGVMFNENIGIWPRAGITYYNVNTEIDITVLNVTGTREITDTGTALTIEVPLVLAPIPHLALTIGPTFDIPLGGSFETTDSLPGTASVTNESDHTIFEFGIHAGLLGWI